MVIAFVFLSSLAFSAQEKKDSLAEVISVGVQNAFGLQSQKLQLEKEENQRWIRYAALLPTLTLTGSHNYLGAESIDATTGDKTMVSGKTDTLNLSAKWTLWDNYKSIRDIHTSSLSLRAARVASKKEIQNYILSLLRAYLEYQLQLSQREILQNLLFQNKWTDKESSALVKAGAKTQVDAMDTEIQVLNTERDLLELENNIATGQRNLQVLINSDQIKNLPRIDLLTLRPYYMSNFEKKIEGIRTQNLSDLNPDLKLLRLELEKTQNDLSQLNLSYFPQTYLTVSSDFNMDNMVNDPPVGGWRKPVQSYSVVLGFTWQFWDWLSTPKNIDSSSKSLEIQRIKYRQTELSSKADAENSMAQIEILNKTIEASRLAVEKAEAQQKFSKEMYRLGRITLLSMQQATNRLFEARNALASRLQSRFLLAAQLLYLNGEDLAPAGLDVSWANEDSH